MFLRILNVRLRFVLLMVLVGLIVGYWDTLLNYYDRWRRPPSAPDVVEASETEYYCPMHPNIIRPDPAQCPICGMPLSKRAKSAAVSLPAGVLARRQLTPVQVEMGRIGTMPVEYRLLLREIRAVGTIDYDETRLARIASRMDGRVEKLLVNFVGQRVEKGDPLAWIYSPELLTTQEGLLIEVRRLEQLRASGAANLAGQQAAVESARQRLLLWGITAEQIDEIIRRGQAQTHLILHSPLAGFVIDKQVVQGNYVKEGDNLYAIADLSTVWTQAKVFEDEIAGLEVGTAVEVACTAYPGEMFAGRIAFVALSVDAATRTVSARIETENPDHKLKPGMYAQAVIRLPVGKVTPIPAEPSSQPAVAESAPSKEGLAAPLLSAYAAISEALLHDRIDEAAVAALVSAAKSARENWDGSSRGIVHDLGRYASAMSGKNLEEQRTIFKTVSAKMIELVRQRPDRRPTLYIMNCPMVEADWLQTVKTIDNPYMGQEMPRCGLITETIAGQDGTSAARFVEGYYCPLTPDRVYEEPNLCPVDRYPLQRARLEKVLVVPVAAVVNTGTRKIVYREAEPGVFEMIEIQIGPRAGEFYPVTSGLDEGNRVATAGAFLVDAENRLNPAAGVQYFGASANP